MICRDKPPSVQMPWYAVFPMGKLVKISQELSGRCAVSLRNPLTRRLAMVKMKKLEDLFHDTLKDVYFAEKKILASLPKMAKAAQHPDLKAAFQKHLGETEGQIDRLEQVFAEIDKKPLGKTCDAIVGIAKEGQEIMDDYKGMPAHDAGLLAAAQAVEHYEMTRYGTLRTWAEELGYTKSAKLLQQTLDQERATDAVLTKLAKAVINLDAEKDEAA